MNILSQARTSFHNQSWTNIDEGVEID